MRLSVALTLTLILLAGAEWNAAQTRKIDSLRRVLGTEKEDTLKVKTLTNLAYYMLTLDPDSTILLARQALSLANKLEWKAGQSGAYTNIGIGYYVKSDLAPALENFQMALNLNEETGNKQWQADDLCNIGSIYYDQGDYPEALAGYLKASKIYDEIRNKRGQASTLSNIGQIYYQQGDYYKALDNYRQGLKLFEAMGDKRGQTNDICNIGLIYADQGNHNEALNYYERALKIDQEIKNGQGQVTDLGNIGEVLLDMQDYTTAQDYFEKALKLAREVGDRYGEANNLGHIGKLYSYLGKFNESEEFMKQAVALDSSIGEKNSLMTKEEFISHLYDTTGQYKLALYWYKKATTLKDTMFNMDKHKALTRKELTYKFNRRQDSVKSAEEKKDAIHREEVKKQSIVIKFISAVLILVLLLALTIFRSLRLNRKKTLIITAQKQEVERKNQVIQEKNKDILDSITYAKSLQDAILPPLSLIRQYIPESFVLYKPKDIVAGDFYWIAPLPSSAGTAEGKEISRQPTGGGAFLIAACDCTGHGVPGAMVSMVCSTALNRAVKEFKITEPGKILDKVREMVVETFHESEHEVQDGMDVSLLSLKRTQDGACTLAWAGAYNSLWYFTGGEMKEIPADKQPIGKTDHPKPFTTHTISLINTGKKDGATGVLYLFTDGFADQFGGPNGKKFKYARLKESLASITDKPMAEQQAFLEKEFEDWRGSMEQTDDVCVIGIKV